MSCQSTAMTSSSGLTNRLSRRQSPCDSTSGGSDSFANSAGIRAEYLSPNIFTVSSIRSGKNSWTCGHAPSYAKETAPG